MKRERERERGKVCEEKEEEKKSRRKNERRKERRGWREKKLSSDQTFITFLSLTSETLTNPANSILLAPTHGRRCATRIARRQLSGMVCITDGDRKWNRNKKKRATRQDSSSSSSSSLLYLELDFSSLLPTSRPSTYVTIRAGLIEDFTRTLPRRSRAHVISIFFIAISFTFSNVCPRRCSVGIIWPTGRVRVAELYLSF